MRTIKNPDMSTYRPVRNGIGIQQPWANLKFGTVILLSRIGPDRMLEYLAYVEQESTGFKFVGETAYTDVQRFVEDTYSQWFDFQV